MQHLGIINLEMCALLTSGIREAASVETNLRWKKHHRFIHDDFIEEKKFS